MKEIISISVFCIINLAMAQRSPYAPRPVGYPTTLEHFNTNTNTGAGNAGAGNAGATDTGNTNNLPNRFGGDPNDKGPLQGQPGQMGDPYLVPHLPDWPREHQPFWYLNQQHIKNHQNQKVPPTRGTGTQQGVNLGSRLGETDPETGAIKLGSRVHTSPFVRRPVDRPDLGQQFGGK